LVVTVSSENTFYSFHSLTKIKRIAAGRSAAQGDDAAVTEETLRLARHGAPDAVTFLRNVVRGERFATMAQRVRAACAVLEVAGFLPSETRSCGAFQEPERTDANADAGENELTLPVARREEWRERVKLARLLDKWLEPDRTFWTATDLVAPSVTSGAMRKKRGVKPGVPDALVWYPGGSITIELKSRRGQCSRSQRAVREALLRAGAQ